jgi:putative sugar O-methyltransferase
MRGELHSPKTSQGIDFGRITLDPEPYEKIRESVTEHLFANPGCALHEHWKRCDAADFRRVMRKRKFEALNWLGDGYPERTKFRNPNPDLAGLANHFRNLDTLDVQSGLYEFYEIERYMRTQHIDLLNLEHMNVVEIGGGYGRLALFFLAYFGAHCHYVTIDFVPMSLTFAPQVIRQVFPELQVLDSLSLDDQTRLQDFNFVSLPAWEIGRVQSKSYLLGMNIHSFQEMRKESYTFYIRELHRLLGSPSVLYIVNNPPDNSSERVIKYEEHSSYGFEAWFNEIGSKVRPFGADWVKICGIPTLERAFVKR